MNKLEQYLSYFEFFTLGSLATGLGFYFKYDKYEPALFCAGAILVVRVFTLLNKLTDTHL
jgi:hypothetical protein